MSLPQQFKQISSGIPISAISNKSQNMSPAENVGKIIGHEYQFFAARASWMFGKATYFGLSH
jgi:hypothetical protein